MKKETVCAKCGSENIIMIPENEVSNFMNIGGMNLKILKISYYTCGTCGFTEHFINTDEQLNEMDRDLN